MGTNLDAEFKAYHEEKERERKEAGENVEYADKYLEELNRRHREERDYISFLLQKAYKQDEEEQKKKAQAEIEAEIAEAESEIKKKYREAHPAQWNETEIDAAYRTLQGQLFIGRG